ncbi:macrosialin-like isoform X2 [Palaemon carinicauda]|uniref:macrosialin-like isoform X2 n=1 Tax=Palaemon carinicauda TaxID=392227 RepID=UPI0035B5BCDF
MARSLVLTVAFLLVAGLVFCSATSFSKDPTTTPTTTSTTTPPKTTTTATTPTTTSTTPTPTTTTTTTTPTTTSTTPTPTTTTTETTPTTTTTETDTTTTTEAHNTTTATSTTSNTTATTSTTAAATTTTPIPEQKYYYNVTDGSAKNKTCILFKGSFNFNITYEANSTKGKTSNKTVSIISPEHPQMGSKVNGSCGKDQYLTFDWDSHKNDITMDFSLSHDGKTWSVGAITATIFMDPETFPDAVDANKTLTITTYFSLEPNDIPVNNSYSCISSSESNNVTGSIDKVAYDLKLTAVLNEDFQLEAYNLVEQGNFTIATKCARKTSTITPIIVGCVLAGLVLIVIIVYVVGRRRRRDSSYESL